MKVRNFLFAGLLISIGFGSCKVSEKQLVDTESNQLETVQEDSVDSKIIYEETVKEIKLYKGERTRHFKLLHTKLELSFDWQRQYLHGKATLIVEPYFYNQSNIILDAKGFEIKNVATVSGGDIKKLNYTYDGNKINIELAKEYSKGQKVNIQLEYIAKPNEADTSNEEVNDRKGLYFINPNGDEKGKPQQIWTHGETDSNSRWFPTIDAPNQKSTQEIFITVDKKYKTLSNGILVYSKSNSATG
jgi:aminopeptidase N